MSNPELLAAAFSAVTGIDIITPQKARSLGLSNLPSISAYDVFDYTYQQSSLLHANAVDEEGFDINIQPLTGSSFTIQVNEYNTISEVKAKITREYYFITRFVHYLLNQDKVLLFNGRKLDDEEVVKFVGIKAGDTLHLRIEHRGGGGPRMLDLGDFDPSFDFDFTHLQPDGQTYMRGNKEYHRPYGWYRYALNVRDSPKYGGDNTWLGKGGIRVENSAGEWPVSYHGTQFGCVEGISKEGYKIGPRAKYGKGVYSSPKVEVAELYAAEFQHEGNNYQVIFQNRVNPARGHLKIVNDPLGIYYVSPLQNDKKGIFDVRPYGVLIKEIH
jgi:hypothetical protein